MLKLWKWSNFVFLTQIVFLVGPLYYDDILQNALSVVVVVALIAPGILVVITVVITAFVAIIAYPAPAVVHDEDTECIVSVVVNAVFVYTFFGGVHIIPSISVTFLLFVSLTAALVVFVAIYISKEKRAKEPGWALFIAVLPLGIGTVCGGLLYFLVFKDKPIVQKTT